MKLVMKSPQLTKSYKKTVKATANANFVLTLNLALLWNVVTNHNSNGNPE